MSKTRIFALFMVAILLICILTNPSKEDLEDAVNAKATALIKEQLQYEDKAAIDLAMTLFGNNIVQKFISNNVTIKNYYLFSTININWEGEITPIGGGALKTVWISPKIDEKANEIIKILKSL